MERFRAQLQLVHTKQVRLIVEPDEIGSDWVPAFECLNCVDVLEWLADKGWWQCPGCSYELTPREAVILLRRSKDVVGKFLKDVRKKTGGRWAWMWPFAKG